MDKFKHAFLIMAHKVDDTLLSLLYLLDDERNDIFIHMDSKNALFQPDELKKIVKKAFLFFTKRTNVAWGGYSQINAELILLKAATQKGGYSYYHLLSGSDLPIKSQNQIHSYFDASNEEFIAFCEDQTSCGSRTRYYYFLQDKYGKHNKSTILKIQKLEFLVQKRIGIHRNKGVKFYKGANWFSITDDFALYVVENEKWIRKTFKFSKFCDEVFIQTLAMNNQCFQERLHKATDEHGECMRLIDWNRGGPYVFRMEDYEMLTQSDRFFARKFDCDVDADIIRRVIELCDNVE